MFYNFSVLHKAPQGPYPKKKEEGFGLVELMVSIGIMVLVATVIMVRQSSFNSAVLLRGQAYKIALQAREVQLSAVSASGNTGSFRSILGLHFNTADNGKYKIFRDANSNGFYNSGEESGQQGVLDTRFEVRAIRAVGDSITGTAVSVVFVRPNFDARFFDSSGELFASSVEIDIASRGVSGTGPGVLRTLEITATGQIAVQ